MLRQVDAWSGARGTKQRKPTRFGSHNSILLVSSTSVLEELRVTELTNHPQKGMVPILRYKVNPKPAR